MQHDIILLDCQTMFLNSYQANTFFELFDAKNSKQKDKTIYRLSNPAILRTFDKQMKNYILEFQSTNNKMAFPKDDKQQLYLVQQYICLQIYVVSATGFSIQFNISDISKTKRRIMFSNAVNKIEKKPFFVKFSSDPILKGRWLNLCFDLWSFMNCFKGQTYRSLDNIYLNGAFRLRKIFTTKTPLPQIQGEYELVIEKSQAILPKHFHYPPGINYVNQLLDLNSYCPEELSDFKNTDFSYNVSSQLKMKDTLKGFSTPKVQPLKSSSRLNKEQEGTKFLSNTNVDVRQRKLQEKKIQQNIVSLKKTSVNKHVKKQENKPKLTIATKTNPELTKTHAISRTTKAEKTSLEKKAIKISPNKNLFEKDKLEAIKLNPWRGKAQQEVKQQIEIDHIQRQIQSANTTLFKKYNKLTQKKFEDPKLSTNNKRNQNNYSDSEYFELSQKFSTITDPKFFKAQINKNIENLDETPKKHYQEEIQEAIQMETNSMRSSIKKNEDINNKQDQYIESSQHPPLKSSVHSREGFMQQHLKKFMNDLERPYTPPISSYEERKQEKKSPIQNKELQLIYDPVLNCYYDFKTNTYYQLKP